MKLRSIKEMNRNLSTVKNVLNIRELVVSDDFASKIATNTK